MKKTATSQPLRRRLGCSNFAHTFAGCMPHDKSMLRSGGGPNLGIVTAYNDLLSAHQPFERFPEIIREAAREVGAVAQVGGGVPAMCDGITQGEPGMELSLFSRDVIALSTALALCHNVFDGVICLGTCDKIIPGLILGALSFAHLPIIFIPAGPMPSGLPNDEKSHIRQLFAEGKVGRDALLEAEAQSYHSPGTCTFYGTSNTNQMMMEFMGLHLPGSSFVNPNTPLRDALTREATHRLADLTALGKSYIPLWQVLDEKAFVNGIVGLLTTGGSTNLSIHLIAMAAAAGIRLTWKDIADIADCVPLLTRLYPNGKADVNHFHAAGGTGFLIRTLLNHGLLHRDVTTAWGMSFDHFTQEPFLDPSGTISWRPAPEASSDENVLRPATKPFQETGGLCLLEGPLGQAIVKISALPKERWCVEAPARVFDTQEQVKEAFSKGTFTSDVAVVVRFQGPKANGIPELHALMPILGILQDRGHTVLLITDGRLSGASGRVPAALHVTPEAIIQDSPLSKVRDGDIIRIDAPAGRLEIVGISEADFLARPSALPAVPTHHFGSGRELFGSFRACVSSAAEGGFSFGPEWFKGEQKS
jgi:phosphogluconate dehydratase